jgi:RNA polymerase sigma-70 factor (ECF subfamily)
MNTTPSDAQDQADMARLTAGDDPALNSIMARHGERLFHYLIRVLQDDNEAADLAQESFVRVFQNRQRFDPDKKFSTWLYAIATNLARDRLRWMSRHPQVPLDSDETDPAGIHAARAATQPTPHEALVTEERAAAVRSALAQLPEELRVPLILSEYEEHSHAEIAAVLDCSAKAVEMRLYRARQQLRARLAPLFASSS